LSAVLVVRDLACTRGGRLLFEHVSLSLRAGDVAIISGANGCGKTSLLRLLAGLLRPIAGDVRCEGGIALLGEASALDTDRRLGDALLFWAAIDRLGSAAGRVEQALADVALDHLADVPVRLLSTGQRRRAAFARVIASDAGLWLLDEPATGLDITSLGLLERAVARHRAGGGVAMVATHQPIALPDAIVLELARYAPVAA
jgi:heme exporter protein A